MTTFQNPETGAIIPVFVHEVFEQHGEQWARVNKGHTASPATFAVRVAHTNLVPA